VTLLTADKISKRFNDQVIFDHVSFSVQDDEKIGLVGKNGSGKTTLFEIMVGRMEVDSGKLNRSKACRIDYIEQDKTEYFDLPLFEFVASAREDLLKMRREMLSLQQHLATNPLDEGGLSRLGQLQSQFEIEGGFSFESEVKIILAGLGFEPERHAERIRNFSGGEKNRAGLARALAGNGNLLLLDEPTNHLDIESTMWLEEYLSKTDRSYLIVSHDRAFLTAAVERVWEINRGKMDFFTGGFEKYLKERAERRKQHEHRYKHQQQEIKRIEEFVRRNMAGQKTKQAQSKLKYLNRIKRLPPPRSERLEASIPVRSSGRSFAHVLSVEDVSLGYGQTAVIEDACFDIYRGDKVGLIGCNGSGKTTVLRALIGELAPMRGEIKLGANVDVAYFDQELIDLNLDATVLDNVWEMDPTAEIGKMRSFLARFGFSGEDCFKLVSSLSGGEKTKLSLARLLYHPANFLIFDEPTNHLDLDSREVLEKALQDFDGSCLIVSHDRFFLDQVVDRIFYLNEGSLRVFGGNYSYFQEKTAAVGTPVKAKDGASKEAYLMFKEKSKRLARHIKRIRSTKARLADLEKELGHVEEDIRFNIPKNDWEKLHEASQRKQKLEEDILDLYAAIEKLEKIDLD
jgi:ATP-binding cassette subfamily F protein 3